jgi:hypothetical protein
LAQAISSTAATAPKSVLGVGLRVALLQDLHLGAHLGEGDARLEACEDVEEIAAVVDLLAVEERRLERPRGEELDLREREARERRRQHADDRVRTSVERQRPADHVALTAEVRLPETVGEKNDGRTAGPLLVGGEGPSELRSDAEQREVVLRDHQRENLLGVAETGDGVGVEGRNGEVAEHPLALAHHLEARPGEAPLDDVLLRVRRAELHDTPRVPVGQGREEDRVDEAEDGGVGADSERQRDHRDGREPGRLPQRTDGVANRLHGSSGRDRGRVACTTQG